MQTERSQQELRKPKSMNFFNVIRKKASKIGKDDLQIHSTAMLAPPPPVPVIPQSMFPLPMAPLTPPPPQRRKQKKSRPKSPEPPPVPSKEDNITLDTNLDEMDGIVNLTIRNDYRGLMNGDASSPGSGFESSYQSSSFSASEGSFHPLASSPPYLHHLPTQHSMFSNPFLPSAAAPPGRRKGGPPHLDLRKVSPKTILQEKQPGEEREQHSRDWVAPESWVVEKEGELDDVQGYATSDDDDDDPARLFKFRKRKAARRAEVHPLPNYNIRIHRSDGSFHSVRCFLTTTVAELIPKMNQRLVLKETRESHSLYVKERERGML